MIKLITVVLLLLILAIAMAQLDIDSRLTLEELVDAEFGRATTENYDCTILNNCPSVTVPTRKVPIVTNNACPSGQECVTSNLCVNGQINSDGTGIIDIRLNDANGNRVNPCASVFETCCSSTTDTPIIPDIPIPIGCGYRNFEGVGFQITGNNNGEAEYGEFPWMVAIVLREEVLPGIPSLAYQCGGSMITPSVVLTAAHCVSGKVVSTIVVRAGEWDTQTNGELFEQQERNAIEYVVHENYYKGGLYNDVALIFLENAFVLSPSITPICLPPPSQSFIGKRCFVTGWGKSVFGKENIYSVILKRIELPIVKRDECQRTLRQTRLGNKFKLHSSFICAGGERGKDACKGDGGSPLVCPIDDTTNRYYQAGIVAWGVGCGDPIPAAYGNVAGFRDWIDTQLRNRNADINPYIYY